MPPQEPMNLETLFSTDAPVISTRSSSLKAARPLLLTPCTAEALLQCGIEPLDLMNRGLDNFAQSPAGSPTPSFKGMTLASSSAKSKSPSAEQQMLAELRLAAYQKRRKELMQQARDVRSRLKSDIKQGIVPSCLKATLKNPVDSITELTSLGIVPETGAGKRFGKKQKQENRVKVKQMIADAEDEEVGTLIKLEKARLEKMRKKQKQEIQQLLAFEMRQAEMKEEAEKRIRADEERKARREKEKRKKLKEQESLKRVKELQKKLELEAEEAQRRQLENAHFKKEREMAILEDKKREDMKREAARKQKEREMRSYELKMQTQKIAKKQEEELLARLRRNNERDRIRKQKLTAAQELIREENEKRMERIRQRIENNKTKMQRILSEKKNKIISKEQTVEEMQRCREMAEEANRLKRQEQLRNIEEKRLFKAKEVQRAMARKADMLRQRQEQEDRMIQDMKRRNDLELLIKQEQNRLAREEKQKRVEMELRKKEYKKVLTLAKINENSERINQMVSQRERLMQKRKQAGIQAKKKREELTQKMAELRRTRKWHEAKALVDDL